MEDEKQENGCQVDVLLGIVSKTIKAIGTPINNNINSILEKKQNNNQL